MRYKIIATILTVILMLTNVLPILASDEPADPDATVTWDAGDTAGEVPGESGEADAEEYFTDINEDSTGTDGNDDFLEEDDSESSETVNSEESEEEENPESDSEITTDEVDFGVWGG